MLACPAEIGAHVVDSLPFSQGGTPTQAAALRADGVRCVVGYLGVINPARLALLLAAGLAFMPVTLAARYDGPAAVAQCQALGLPPGVTVWLDLEGQSAFKTEPTELIARINAWADAIRAAGFMAGLYVGVPQPLTSAELWSLHVERYWHGQGSVRDRHDALAEPACGWCMTQMFPQHVRDGVLVDDDMIGQDYRGRVPSWAIAG